MKTLVQIRERRHYYEQHIDYVYDMSEEVLKRVRRAIGVEYFENMQLRHSIYIYNIDNSMKE